MFEIIPVCITILAVAFIGCKTYLDSINTKARLELSNRPDEKDSELEKRVEDLEKFESEAKSKINGLTMGQAFKV